MNVIHYKMLRTICIAAVAAVLTGALPALTFAQEQAAETPASQEEPGIFAFESEDEPPLFDDSEPAIDAFKKALADNDFDGLAKLLGLDAAKVKEAEGAMDTFAQIREGAAKQVVISDIENGNLLQIGEKLWPFPFPLLQGDDGKWAFDTQAGLEEIVNRRVGENELEAIATVRSYVEAQKDYAEQDRDGSGETWVPLARQQATLPIRNQIRGGSVLTERGERDHDGKPVRWVQFDWPEQQVDDCTFQKVRWRLYRNGLICLELVASKDATGLDVRDLVGHSINQNGVINSGGITITGAGQNTLNIFAGKTVNGLANITGARNFVDSHHRDRLVALYIHDELAVHAPGAEGAVRGGRAVLPSFPSRAWTA